MLEARALLKESTRADMKGDMEASQRLRAKAANRRARAASHHAPTPFPHMKPSRPAPRRTEVELLEGLEAIAQNLHKLMANARLSDSPHPLQN